jgi:hypothetical protein
MTNGGVEIVDMNSTVVPTECSVSFDDSEEEDAEMDQPLSDFDKTSSLDTPDGDIDQDQMLDELETLDGIATSELPAIAVETVTSSDSDDTEFGDTGDSSEVKESMSGAEASGEESESELECRAETRKRTEGATRSKVNLEAQLDRVEAGRRNPYRFSPDSFAIGVLDHTGMFKPGFHTPIIQSSIAFDARKKAFLLDLIPTIPEQLPTALELVDACIKVEDIIEGGVAIIANRVNEIPVAPDGSTYERPDEIVDVTMTITTRRPPQFFMPVLDEHLHPVYKSGKTVEATRLEFQRVTNQVFGTKYSTEQPNRNVATGGFGALRRQNVLPKVPEGALVSVMHRRVIASVQELRQLNWQGYTKEFAQRQSSMRKAGAYNRPIRRRDFHDTPKEQIGFGNVHPQRAEAGAVLRWRRATEFDFSGSFNGWERDAGPINPDGDVRYKVRPNLLQKQRKPLLISSYDTIGKFLADDPSHLLHETCRVSIASRLHAKTPPDRRGRQRVVHLA